ncbi:MAG: helix-turn-helix domain-containing protein [Lachnospiraceae bacterium]|nr:helix-turn-helix domain-containing protein [Lachnospiraceae bacterium]
MSLYRSLREVQYGEASCGRLYGDDRTLDTHIKRLRSSLEEYRSCIVTLRGVGYRFDDHI